MKYLCPIVLLICSMQCSIAQSVTPLELYDILRSRDSLLFSAVFNNCDSMVLKALISDDLEFYHDLSGVTNTKETFIQGVQEMCHLPYKPRRELDAASLRVFPLYDQGRLYGAIQTGSHRFYAWDGEGKPEYLTSTAKFTHLWLLENDEWKLKTVLSYDHKPANH